MATRDELVVLLRARYARSGRAEQGRILDEFSAVTDFHRKHAMRLLGGGQPNQQRGPAPAAADLRRCRARGADRSLGGVVRAIGSGIGGGGRRLRGWRDAWLSALSYFLPLLVLADLPSRDTCAGAARRLAIQLRVPLPESLKGERVGIPSPFQRLDLTHQDVLELGRRLMDRCPDRQKPIVPIGLRTSGSYFAPLIKALLEREGYATVSLATLEPNVKLTFHPGHSMWATQLG